MFGVNVFFWSSCIAGLSIGPLTCNTCHRWERMMDPWYFWWTGLQLIQFTQPKTFAAGARVKAPDDYKVLDHPAWNAAQTESGWKLLQYQWYSTQRSSSENASFNTRTINLISEHKLTSFLSIFSFISLARVKNACRIQNH